MFQSQWVSRSGTLRGRPGGHDAGRGRPRIGSSVDAGNDPVAHRSAVLVPRRAVLPSARVHVAGVSVHQEDEEVDDVVPGQQVAEACRQEGHNIIHHLEWALICP